MKRAAVVIAALACLAPILSVAHAAFYHVIMWMWAMQWETGYEWWNWY